MARAIARRLLWALNSVTCECGPAWTPAAAAAVATSAAPTGGAASLLQHRAWPLVQHRWLSTSVGTADSDNQAPTTSGQQQTAAVGLPPGDGGDARGFVLSPGDRSQAAVSMRTRAVLAALQASEQPLSSHQLYDRVREMFPAAGISSRHHFKQLVKRLRDSGWVKPRPGKGGVFEFTLTEHGKRQPVEGAPKSRHLRLAEEQAAHILAAPGGSSMAGSAPSS